MPFVPSSVLVTTSKALVTTSVAPVTTSVAPVVSALIFAALTAPLALPFLLEPSDPTSSRQMLHSPSST